MIRVVLLAALLVIAGFTVFGKNSGALKAGKKFLFLCVLAAGSVTIVFPGIAQAFAELLGVGRGTDLLLYMLTMVTLSSLLMSYLEFKRFARREARLVQAIAILEARIEDLELRNQNSTNNKTREAASAA